MNGISPADNHGWTPPCQGRYHNQVAFISDLDTLSSIKAILATQFDAFDKGKVASNKYGRKITDIWNLRTYFPLPIQLATGRRSFQCWWYTTIIFTCHYLLTDHDLYRWNVEVRTTHSCYTFNLIRSPQDSTEQWLVHSFLENVLATLISTIKIVPAHWPSQRLD